MAAKPKQKGKDEIKILYVEDDPDTLETYLSYIRDNWGDECKGVRSLYSATRLLEIEGFRPDLVIHDCKPLPFDEADADSIRAGNMLYALFVRREFPVVVISAYGAEEMMPNEPYRSHEPLAFLSKPASREHFDEAVRIYRESLEKKPIR